MALQKSITTPFQITCPSGYYRVEEVNISWKDKRANIVLFGYKDQTTAARAKTDLLVRPLEVAPVVIEGADFTFKRGELEDVVKTAYTIAKAKERFAGSVDV